MVSKSPKWVCSTSKWPKWLINRGYYPLTNWDDPPSKPPFGSGIRPPSTGNHECFSPWLPETLKLTAWQKHLKMDGGKM